MHRTSPNYSLHSIQMQLCFTDDQDLCIGLVLTTPEIARVLDLNKKAQGLEHSSIECDDKSHF